MYETDRGKTVTVVESAKYNRSDATILVTQNQSAEQEPGNLFFLLASFVLESKDRENIRDDRRRLKYDCLASNLSVG